MVDVNIIELSDKEIRADVFMWAGEIDPWYSKIIPILIPVDRLYTNEEAKVIALNSFYDYLDQ